MKTSRGPSPTPTAFSGISNYRTDSYRPLRDLKGAPAVPTIDYRQVSKIHYAELGKYLASYLAKGTDFFLYSMLSRHLHFISKFLPILDRVHDQNLLD